MKLWWLRPIASALVPALVLALAACGRGEDPAPAPAGTPAPAAPAEAPAAGAAATPALDDVIERTPRYVVGISYPQEAKKYPGLAVELDRYAQAAREELLQAAAAAGEGTGGTLYDLSLEFRMLAETPRLVAVAADGSSYTGGAHGNPLVARFVWLPAQERLLQAGELIPDEAGWRDVSGYVREALYAALSQRIDAEELEPAERSQILRTGGQMIDEGSAPAADKFDLFEPVLTADGRIEALRFVFPPYQVGPYADGTQSVLVPAEVLLPHVAADYRDLFATAPAAAPTV